MELQVQIPHSVLVADRVITQTRPKDMSAALNALQGTSLDSQRIGFVRPLRDKNAINSRAEKLAAFDFFLKRSREFLNITTLYSVLPFVSRMFIDSSGQSLRRHRNHTVRAEKGRRVILWTGEELVPTEELHFALRHHDTDRH